jgi:hypothetical protein
MPKGSSCQFVEIKKEFITDPTPAYAAAATANAAVNAARDGKKPLIIGTLISPVRDA